ncbi:sulfatase-like hydrolase/transferase [Metabacillus halosaccharovorans]|uniref:sulfatase-like hydrolase/transferase n=1 Tax=Metabacillus halosaccharovorans TaxID=930124 RepID=UPI00203B2BC4|nr:sulfatase-like hydrolase/transferase [Metabacillus halosaccharovorans]MCM3439428.1 sulfatase-like hydrolase/transferase [Metabacillus halosaccharovorans]
MGKPNFIIFYADDLGYGDLGCFGSEEIKTPNLDELANNGVRLTNWYSNSPVCSPSRASLMTGKYPKNCGISQILGGKRGTSGLPSDQLTLAKVLKSNGYRTGLFGKWHLGVSHESSPNAHGFEEFFGILAGCVDYYSHIFYWEQWNGVNPVHDLWENKEEVWHNGEYLTELISEKAIQFIKKTEDDPFFLYVPYNAPHYPMHAPQKYVDRYPDLPPERRIMAAMISAMDDGIGSIIKTLKDENKYEDTVIFFSSDNGPSTEARNYLDGTEDLYYGGSAGIFRGHKASLFDGGIREPAILSCPSLISSGKQINEIGIMMDIFPTFLEMAGIDLPENYSIDGMSILDMVLNESPTPHESICWEYNDQFAIRKNDWKLVINGKLDFTRMQPDEKHLSNLRIDPSERHNLIDQYPEIASELKKELYNWREVQDIPHTKE